MDKFYLWVVNGRIDHEYDSFDDALEAAMNNEDVVEIERTTWNSEESYKNYEPADKFKTMWKRK